MPVVQCRWCGADIFFAETEKGRRIPVDPKPTAAGNLVLMHEGGRTLALSFSPASHAGRDRYISHFATCPHAGEHRRGRR